LNFRNARRALNPGRRLRALVFRWRSSMQARVVTTALMIGVITVGALGTFLSINIRDGLFTQRVQELDQEAARSAGIVQEAFASTPVSTLLDAQLLVFQMVQSASNGAVSAHGTMLVYAGDLVPPPIIDAESITDLTTLITGDLRGEALESEYLVWQSVQIPAALSASGQDEPGVMFGTQVEVPLAGRFGLFTLYSLQPQAETLRFVQRTLVIGAAAILAIIGAITALVTRQAVRPVRRAAATAARLADGQLDERMPSRGYDEMATLARSFNEMAASLQDQIRRMEALSRAQRTFVSDVSHELRTPLTTIRMAGEVIHGARAELDPAARRSAELLQQQLDRFEELLADLLEISRFDAGAAVLDVEQADLTSVASLVVEAAMPLAEAKGSFISMMLPDVPVKADIDPRRVGRILRNLVTNAVEHSEGNPVEVHLGYDDNAVAIAVRDHGIGMTMEQVARVFDRFWRADPARARTTGGTGLGLSISLEDARLHSGRLEAWGMPGEGASFRLTLPRRAGLPVDDPPLPLVPEPRAVAPKTPITKPTPTIGMPTAIPDLSRFPASDSWEDS